jgi:hypothetical protein
VAVAAYASEPVVAIRFGGGGSSSSSKGSAATSGDANAKPKETPYYPSSIGMFFPFGSASASSPSSSSASSAAMGSKKSPFAALCPPSSESPPVVKKDGSNNINSSAAGTALLNRDGAPAATTTSRTGGGDPTDASEIALAKPTAAFYYPGTSPHTARAEKALPGQGGASSSVQDTGASIVVAEGDVASDGGWDDYSRAVRYCDLPRAVYSADSPDLLPLSPSSSSSSSSQPPRTAFRVSNVPLSTVLSRIATFLKIHSVTCDPKGLVRDGDGTLACVTRRHCQFAVMIWRLEEGGATESGESPSPSRPVLIAIERRQGCCVELQRMRQALKRAIETGRFPSAAEGKEPLHSAGCHQPAMPSSSRSSRHSNPMTIAPLIKELYERQQQQQKQQHVHTERVSAEPGPTQEESQECHEGPPSAARVQGSGVRRRSSLDGISTCASLLASQCLYKQQLGLENLVAMTDPSRGVDLETAQDVTDALLLPPPPPPPYHHHQQDRHGHVPTAIPPDSSDYNEESADDDDDDELFKRLQQEFISFFVSSEEAFHDVTQSQAFSLSVSPAPAPKTFPDLTESPLQRTIRHSLALEALCNALQVTKSSACRCGGGSGGGASSNACAGPCPQAGSRLDFGSDFWRAVIPALLLDVTHARSRPHDAALSAKCLALLNDFHEHKTGGTAPSPQRAPPPSTSSSRHMDCLLCLDYVETLLPYLVQARSYGSRHHLLLEREANELILRLQRQQQQQQQGRRPTNPVVRHPSVPSPQLQSF